MRWVAVNENHPGWISGGEPVGASDIRSFLVIFGSGLAFVASLVLRRPPLALRLQG